MANKNRAMSNGSQSSADSSRGSQGQAGERTPLLSNKEYTSPSQQKLAKAHKAYRKLIQENEHLLSQALYPEDAFSNNIYWADLSAQEQAGWIKRQAKKEVNREWTAIRDLARQGFFKPIQAYWTNYAVAGVGFFIEGYVLFSVGNVEPLFKSVYPDCFDNGSACNENTIKMIKYMEIVGIICGQIIVGYLGDAIGRRWGLIQDAGIMLMGVIMLAVMWGTSLQGWLTMYVVAIFIFGLGVGGEYPMTSTSSIEGMKGADDRGHRGRSACLAFLMQGWGQLANQVVLILLATVTSNSRNLSPPYTREQTQITFRISFAIAAGLLVYFLYLRIFKLSAVDESVKENRLGNGKAGYDYASFKFVLSRFWARLLASSICWFCSDFAFYGMQIFRNDLLELVTGTSSKEVDKIWTYNLINIGCQLIGYYLAAMLIDYKPYGRRRMQVVGFAAQLIIYGIIWTCFPVLNRPGTGAKVFQGLYFLANFWVQFGPNATTFLLAAEIFPVGVRSTAHGFSAAMGKVGALTATVLFAYVGNRTKFILAALAMLVGLGLTIFFVPDTTGLDLAEMQRAWGFVTTGRVAKYHGIAVHRHHLSWFEKIVRKRDLAYDIGLDRNQRVNELRGLYEKSIEEVLESNHEGGLIDQNLIRYFELERSCYSPEI